MLEPLTQAAPPQSPAPKEPVVATVVRPGPSRWQFGLKALLGLMAVCCVQFAMMRYLGVPGGLGVSLGICGVAFACMIFTAVCLIGSRSSLMEKLDYYGIRLALAMVVLFLGTLFAG